MATGRKGKTTRSSNKNSNKTNAANDLLNGGLSSKKLAFIVAALLVSGKLRVDAVTLFREATLLVTLTGRYKTLKDFQPSNADQLKDFLDQNGDMTINDIIQVFQQRMNS